MKKPFLTLAIMIKKNIPNFFTVCNLLCGCIAIISALHFDLLSASYFIFIAGVFDFFDGFVARALKAYSELGKQLDSLADMISFGIAPGMIMFELISISNNHLSPFIPAYTLIFRGVSMGIPLIALLIPIFSAIRLAKFNIDARQSNSFIGLPTPANAIVIASLPFIVYKGITSIDFTPVAENNFLLKFVEGDSIHKPEILNPIYLTAITIIFSFLLVAPLPLFALKFKNFSWADNKVRYIFLLLSLVLLIIFQFVGIPLIIILYIILSIINNILTRSKTQS